MATPPLPAVQCPNCGYNDTDNKELTCPRCGSALPTRKEAAQAAEQPPAA